MGVGACACGRVCVGACARVRGRARARVSAVTRSDAHLSVEDGLDELAALREAEELGQRPRRRERLEPSHRAWAEDQHAVRALATQHLHAHAGGKG
eukprot:2123368-Pleurochrysis_carterae.AAC.1